MTLQSSACGDNKVTVQPTDDQQTFSVLPMTETDYREVADREYWAQLNGKTIVLRDGRSGNLFHSPNGSFKVVVNDETLEVVVTQAHNKSFSFYCQNNLLFTWTDPDFALKIAQRVSELKK